MRKRHLYTQCPVRKPVAGISVKQFVKPLPVWDFLYGNLKNKRRRIHPAFDQAALIPLSWRLAAFGKGQHQNEELSFGIELYLKFCVHHAEDYMPRRLICQAPKP